MDACTVHCSLPSCPQWVSDSIQPKLGTVQPHLQGRQYSCSHPSLVGGMQVSQAHSPPLPLPQTPSPVATTPLSRRRDSGYHPDKIRGQQDIPGKSLQETAGHTSLVRIPLGSPLPPTCLLLNIQINRCFFLAQGNSTGSEGVAHATTSLGHSSCLSLDDIFLAQP